MSHDTACVAPFDLVSAFYDELDRDISGATPRWRTEACAHAEVLLADGCTLEQVRRLAQYLGSQTWRTSEFTLKTARAVFGDWVIAGEPAAEQSSAPDAIDRDPAALRAYAEQQHQWRLAAQAARTEQRE